MYIYVLKQNYFIIRNQIQFQKGSHGHLQNLTNPQSVRNTLCVHRAQRPSVHKQSLSSGTSNTGSYTWGGNTHPVPEGTSKYPLKKYLPIL